MEESLGSVRNAGKANIQSEVNFGAKAVHCWENIVGEGTVWEAVIAGYLIMNTRDNGRRVGKLCKGVKG